MGLCNGFEQGAIIIRTLIPDKIIFSNIQQLFYIYRYQEMSGELSIRSTYFLRGFSPRTFYEPCIQKLFSTFQIYLFHCFYVCFLKGHGEKLFGKGSLQGFFIFWKGFSPRFFYFLERVLFKNIL